MASLLRKCERCGVMIAKGHPCPECHWSASKAEAEETGRSTFSHDLVGEFERREKAHMRNYAIFMLLMMGTGLVGLWTAWLWIRFIFFGSIRAFFLIGFCTLLTAALGVMLKFSKRICPTELHCPGCELRLDQLGTIDSHCPNCGGQLKAHAATNVGVHG